jgi:signal transduction histidine kinase
MDEGAVERRRFYAIYALAWLPCLAIYFAAFAVNGVPFWHAAHGALANVLPDALLGTFVLRLPRRLPPPQAKARFFAAQLALLSAFVAVSSALWVALVSLDGLFFEGALRLRFDARIVPWRVLSDVLVYGALSGLSYAWHNALRAARADALRVRAELEAMRSQLNPHFILNTFQALLGLLRRDPAVAERALERLGDLLRHSLRVQREGVDEVTLRDEWSFVGTYLELERLRLGDRLRVRCDAGASALDCLVPSFSVQTLVENAVRHAIAPRAAGGQLAVTAQRANGRLRIEVQDDGAGAPAMAEGNGIGLRLLHERLAALYEGRASLSVEVAGGGVRAVLDLPERPGLGTP